MGSGGVAAEGGVLTRKRGGEGTFRRSPGLWFVVSHSSTIKPWMNGAQRFSVIS